MKRTHELGPFRDSNGELYPPTEEDLARELIGLSFAAARWGGSLLVVPKRLGYPDGTFETVGWIFTYQSGNVPAVDAPAKREEKAPPPEGDLTADEMAAHFPEPPADSEPVPEPALAE